MLDRRSACAFDAVLLACLLVARPVLAQGRPTELQKEIVVPQFDATHQRDVPNADYWDKYLTYDPEKGTVTRGRAQKEMDLEDF